MGHAGPQFGGQPVKSARWEPPRTGGAGWASRAGALGLSPVLYTGSRRFSLRSELSRAATWNARAVHSDTLAAKARIDHALRGGHRVGILVGAVLSSLGLTGLAEVALEYFWASVSVGPSSRRSSCATPLGLLPRRAEADLHPRPSVDEPTIFTHNGPPKALVGCLAAGVG